MWSNPIWWGAEEVARPGIIIKGGAVVAATEAIAGQAMAQPVEGPATYQGQVLGAVVFPGSAGIPAKVHVQDPVL